VLRATAEHPFFVTTAPTAFYPGQVKIAGGWVNAADLAVGDVVRTADGGSAVVAGVTVAPVTTGTLDWAFNLTVANDHTYYVGEQPVLVHNSSCPIHANSLDSPKPTTFYQLWTHDGVFLKHGITSNPGGHYSRTYLNSINAKMVPLFTGSRRAVAAHERQMVLKFRGSMNRERWR
jgi:hypothetical protein